MSEQDAIPLLDLGVQNGPLRDQLRAAFDRVLDRNEFILGSEVDAFEREIGRHLGVEYAIGVSSGTDALLLALMALGIGPGHEVITTPYTFFATAGCIVRAGARPVFVDIDPRTFNLDVSKVESAITERTRAIMPVHLFGQACELTPLIDLCKARGLFLIEDAAQAIGARSQGQAVGTLGDFGCFSFFPSKNLGAFGDAGLLVTRDADLAKRARLLRAHGASPKYIHALVGANFRIDALQAALLRVKLPHLDHWTEGRRKNAESYDRLFAAAGLNASRLTTPNRAEAGHIYNQYVIRTDRRDALKAHLQSERIGCEVYYPLPMHLQQCFADLNYKPGDFPESERASRETLALPIFPELGEARLQRVATTVVEFLRA
jgi:dTDP-4-amino-4,6-dideoxygalactose transaminase